MSNQNGRTLGRASIVMVASMGMLPLPCHSGIHEMRIADVPDSETTGNVSLHLASYGP